MGRIEGEPKIIIPLEPATKPRTREETDVIFLNEKTIIGKEAGEYLRMKGLVKGAGTVQGDIATATAIEPDSVDSGSDKPLCDHNCDEAGGYRCPARRLANLGLNSKRLAPAEKLNHAFITAANGIYQFNRRFVEEGGLEAYGNTFNIPPDIQSGIAYNLMHEKIMANIFGGNAEMHPDALMIAENCHNAGMDTTVTTTSGILLSDSPRGKAFLEKLLTGNVNILAVTAEFQNAGHVKKLAAKTRNQLKETLREIPFELGQPRKGIEAINAAQLQNIYGDRFPQILFNLVVHPGILDHIEETIAALKENFPGAIINPYPAQSSFDRQPPVFATTHVPALTKFIDQRLKEQKNGDKQMTTRPHYYAMLKAVTDTYDGQPEMIARMLSGYDVWKCYDAPYGINGAGHAVQFGASPERRNLTQIPYPGGYLACFWNERTVTQHGEQLWNMQPNAVAAYIDGGMQSLAEKVDHPCDGCLMPRLNEDLQTLELGMNPALQSAYLRVRKQTIGF